MSVKAKILSALFIMATILFLYLFMKYEWAILTLIYGAVFILFMIYAPFEGKKAKQPDTKDMSKKQKQIESTDNGSYTLSGACALNDKILAEAFSILFYPQWKRNWTDKDKANEMRSIIQGRDMPCRPFMNYAECIDFLSRQITNIL